MKARIRKTGEIVEVYHETQHGTSKDIQRKCISKFKNVDRR